MANEIPTLTFEPFNEETVKLDELNSAIVKQEATKEEKLLLDESILTSEEKKMVNDFANQIDLTKSNQILQYGVGAQKKIADFSESALNNAKTKDLGEIGDMLSGVVTELKSFNIEEEEKGFLGMFKKSSNRLTAMKAKYDKAEVNINKICTVLETHQMQLLKDIAMLDKMYDLNKTYYKELSMYVFAGKK
ncbi:MAG: toxic anion resistance protein, partial [Mobilitalea sp.]